MKRASFIRFYCKITHVFYHIFNFHLSVSLPLSFTSTNTSVWSIEWDVKRQKTSCPTQIWLFNTHGPLFSKPNWKIITFGA